MYERKLEKMDFDCIIPTAGRECLLLRRTIPYLINNLQPDKVYIITKKIFFSYFIGLSKEIKDKVVLLDEDSIIEGVCFETIKRYLIKYGHNPKMAGWYYQQFIKMGFAFSKFAKEYYLSWDADTIPVRKISFFDALGNPYFTTKDEFHNPYFVTIKKILGIDKVIPKSFISENMIFSKVIMKHLISEIDPSANFSLHWCEKIIAAIPRGNNNGFSEFETYGTFSFKNYPEKYTLRELRTYRDAGKEYTRLVSKQMFNELALQYDMISIEYRDNPKTLVGYYMILCKMIQRGGNTLLMKYV
ncbi:DUF6492 family protein [Spirosoma pulveris]